MSWKLAAILVATVFVSIILMSVHRTCAGQITYDNAAQAWTLQSGAAQYRLQQGKGATLELANQATGKPVSLATPLDTTGLVEGQNLAPEDVALVSHESGQARPDCPQLKLRYKHRRLPLEIEMLYTAWGDTGVFTRQVTLHNTGNKALRMDSVPSLAWHLPAGEYTLDYLYRSGSSHRQLATEKLTYGRKAFESTSGRSTLLYSPWFSLRNEKLGMRCAAQLFSCGNWQMSFDCPDGSVRVELGIRFDFGGAGVLGPGASFEVPAVAFTCSGGDLDDIANQLHRYQRRYVIARTPTNDPMLTQFNTWYVPVRRAPTAASAKRYADVAAELGLEAFIIDAGWFSDRGSRRDPIFGDWEADPVAFPKGLREVADYVHAKGMKFGVWLEIETAGEQSRVFREHPDWILRYDGKPMFRKGLPNAYLNFTKPEVRRWARAVIDRLVQKDKIDYWRLDHNVDLGERFDPPEPEQRSGTVLYEHIRHFLAFLDEVRAAYPNLVLENCAGGGKRFDLSTLARTHTQWVSDIVDPRASIQLAYGATLEFLPEACNHWMVGDDNNGTVDPSKPPGWWDFMFRVPMNGQFGISSKLLEWSPEVRKCAAENIALYKRLRPVLTGADVYHLTAPPAAGKNPTGWMALQYTHEDGKRSAVLVFRLGESQPSQTLRLRGLDPRLSYRVTEEGRPRGVFTGQQLSADGLTAHLEAPWRSSVIELQAR